MSGGKEGGRSTELPLFGTPEKGERKKAASTSKFFLLSLSEGKQGIERSINIFD